MITPSFALTATERVLPKLALDFTTASLDPRITFTRSGNTATVTNSTGVIAAVNADIPRFDYNPVTLICKGLLIEESRTNQLLYSEDFSNGAYTLIESSVTSNAAVSPDGNTTADKLIPSANSSSHACFQNSSVTAGVTYTQTFYAKAGEYGYLNIYGSTGFSSTSYVNFNLTNGTIGTTSGAWTYDIENAGNGWYRCTVSAACTGSSATGRLVFRAASTSITTGASTYAGDGTSGIYIWGAQLEAGAFATSYIPTTTTVLTRNADVATMTGTNFSDWFNASEGTFEAYGTTAPGISGTQYILSATDGTTSNMILMYRQLSGYMGTGVYTAGVVQHDSNTGVLQASSSNVNGALSVKAGGAYRAFNAANNTAIGLTTMPSVNQFQIGNRTDLARAWNGTIARINYYPQKLTNSEVLAISK